MIKFRIHFVEPGRYGTKAKNFACLIDVNTALLNTQFDGSGILLLMVPTAKELVANMFQ